MPGSIADIKISAITMTINEARSVIDQKTECERVDRKETPQVDIVDVVARSLIQFSNTHVSCDEALFSAHAGGTNNAGKIINLGASGIDVIRQE